MLRHPALARSLPAAAVLLFLLAPATRAQQPPPAPVRWTAVQESAVRSEVQLTGTVESATTSLVASEVAGLVVELPRREGELVKRGDVVARLRTDELEIRLAAAKGQRKEAQARLERAERALGRAKELLQSEAISDDQFDDAWSEFNAWQGRQEQLEAEIAGIELDLRRCVIQSLVSGTVVSERCEVGEWMGVGQPVVEIVDVEHLEVRVDLPERWFRQLSLGSEVQVAFESQPGLVITGKLVTIIPRAEPLARTFPVKVAISNPDGRIGAGMLATVSLPVGEPLRSLLVPKDAVVSGPRGTAVWVMAEDGSVGPVPVQTGSGAGAWVVVEAELQPGQRVVTRGNERLRPGMTVQGEPLEYELP